MIIESLDLEKAKSVIVDWAKSKTFITKVYLFGSRVSGTSKKTGMPVRPDSDLDIAIEFNNFSRTEDSFTTWTFESSKWHKELLNLR
jgi:predicted nucleotidyltransferase